MCAALALPLTAAEAAHAGTYVTTGTSASSEWSDPANWTNQTTSQPGVPGATDTAVINSNTVAILTANTTVGAVEVKPGGSVSLAAYTLTSAGNVALRGDYWTPSSLASYGGDGALKVAGKLTVENTSVNNVAVTIAQSGGSTPGLELSGPVDPSDTEASSYWSNSTLKQTGGTAAFNGHTFTGQLDPELTGVALTVSGINDFTDRMLTLGGSGTVAFKPAAVTPMLGAPLLKLGSLLVTGSQSASVAWDAFPSTPEDEDKADLATVSVGNTNGLTATDSAHAAFTRASSGAKLSASYIGIPKPKALVLPTISVSTTLAGHVLPGYTLTCNPGTWSPDGTKAYAWTVDGSPVGGATSSTYTVQQSDATYDIACVVTVTSSDSKVGTATSATLVHVDATPLSIFSPEVQKSGVTPATVQIGETLTCDPGTWTADTPTYTYAWKRGSTTISGAIAATYTTVSADGGNAVGCSVTAKDGLATSSAEPSDNTVSVLNATPVATVKPTAQSSRTPGNRATLGDPLSCGPGTWNPDGAKVYAWKRGSDTIAGATGASYTLGTPDVGSDVTCSVSVTVGGATGTETSNAVKVVATPVNSVLPAITGSAPKVGTTATCSPGTWSGNPSFTYQWTLYGIVLADEHASTHVIGSNEQGTRLGCIVTATAETITGSASSATRDVAMSDPTITITSQPTGTIIPKPTSVSYTIEPGVTITGCTLNGAALASCASPIQLSGLADNASYTLVLESINGGFDSDSATVSFLTSSRFAMSGWPAAVMSGDIVHIAFAINGENPQVTCRVDDLQIPCTTAGATVPIMPSDWGSPYHDFFVTVTTSDWTETFSHRYNGNVTGLPTLPRVVSVPVGATVTSISGTYLGNYQFRGPLKSITSTGDVHLPASWGVKFTAPDKPGTYVEELYYGGGEKLAEMTVNAFAEDTDDLEHQLGGADSKTAPLTCPKGSPGSTYSWYVNDKLRFNSDSNLLPTQSVPKNGTVYCIVNDPKGYSPAPIRVLVDDGNRMAATTDGQSVAVTISAPIKVEIVVSKFSVGKGFVASAGKKKAKKLVTLGTYTQTLKKGKNTIKLKTKLPKSGFQLSIRMKRAKGGYSKPLVLGKG